MMWSDFEHQMWAQFKKAGLQDKESYLIAVSGGLDSVALLHLVLRLKPKAKIRVVHYHHGPSQEPAQQKYGGDVREFL